MQRKSSMEKIAGSGVFCGLMNKTREENGRWWHTRKWLVQSGVWLALIDGLSLIALFQMRQTEAGFTLNGFMTTYMGLMGWFVAFGIIILTQGDIIEEKQSGTAEWILSSPLSRESFILSKLAVNLGWLLVVLVLANGVVFNLVIEAVGVGSIPWTNLAQALSFQGLALVFWLTLVLMLGTLFKTRNAVIGVPLIFLFTQTLIPTMVGSSNTWLSLILPKSLSEYAAYLVLGQALPSAVPIVSVAAASMVFVLLAILRFKREEFKGT